MPGPTADAPDTSPAAVLAQLETILTEVVGDDLLLDGPLTMETSFSDDLQLESIEFVALAEELLTTYGEKVDFVGWMSTMELDQVVALTAGQVADFVVTSLADPADDASTDAAAQAAAAQAVENVEA